MKVAERVLRRCCLLLWCCVVVASIVAGPRAVTALNLVPSSGSGFSISRDNPSSALPKEAVVDFINNNVVPENIRGNLRYLSSKPHLAGTIAEVETAQWVADTWRQYGVDDVNMADYEVLLSYPDPDAPNFVRLLDSGSGAVLAESNPRQPALYAPEESRDDVPYSFNAYSAPGTVQGEVVYAHYGREEDFKFLESMGMSILNRIVIARYGMVFRGNIVASAEARGASGVILYTDPEDYAVLGPDAVYPNTVMMPPSGAQLGTAKLIDGDPLTPYYPAIESAFHIPEEEAAIPKIPVQPLSYEDAYFVLNSLGGDEAPQQWQGNLNITYRLGPTQEAYKVNLEVHTSNQPATVHNVIGVIRGSEEPDRYVLLGNHRDAWIFGAIDPSSGTAVLVELVRVLMQLRNETGWTPRRSLVFCSWAAEEYGLVGSVEWTEQYAQQLRDRAVAYLNVDLAILGNYSFKATSVPLLYDVVWDAAKQVGNPDPDEVAAGRTTVYDTWVLRAPGQTDDSLPIMEMVGSGSDHKGFLHNIGVPSLDVCYNHDDSIPGWYPLYHTLYETFELVDELYDSGFGFQAAVAEVWGIIATTLADAEVLPLSLSRYSSFILAVQVQILQDFGEFVQVNNRSFDYFIEAGTTFAASVTKFEDSLPFVDLDNPLAVRRANDQLMAVERAFIDSRGLPDRPDYNHVVLAPSASDAYSGTAFSGLTDALVALNGTIDDPIERQHLWRNLDQHLAVTTHLLNTAAAVLSDQLW